MSPEPHTDRPATPFPRALRRDGEAGPLVFGHARAPLSDIYHQVLALPLAGVLALMGLTFVVINLVFAELYLRVGGVANLAPGDHWNAFFFSVETFGTIGYGYLYPSGRAANLLMTAETFTGLVYVALATGLVFARVSRPTARVTFSRQAVITEFDGVPTLMFRAANRRANQILEAEVLVNLARDGITAEGQQIRRFEELRIRRARSPLFALTWTVMHPIDESSPLWGATADILAAQRVEIIVVLSGVDDRYAQRVHARHAYLADEIAWNKRLADILSVDPGGRRVVDYRRFHDVVDA
jgi:inward rectifier potassium channel